MPTTEEFKQQRDQIMSLIMARFGSQNQELQQELEKLADTTALADDLEGLNRHQKFKLLNMMYTRMGNIFGTKKIRTYLLIFLMGAVITLIPTLLYVNTLKKDDIPPFQFVSNAMGYPKDEYVQVIKTKDMIDIVKNSKIRDSNMVDMGSALKLGRTGLNLMPSDEMKSPSYHLKFVGLQENLIRNVNGFLFKPDTLWSRDPIQFHLITTEVDLESIREDKTIDNRDLLSIGAGVVCPSKQCFVTAKSTLDTEYSKVVPLSEV